MSAASAGSRAMSAIVSRSTVENERKRSASTAFFPARAMPRVQGDVGVDERVDVAALARRIARGQVPAQTIDIVAGPSRGGQAGGLELQHAADLVHLARRRAAQPPPERLVAGGGRPHVTAIAPPNVDVPSMRQHADGLAQRRATHPELRRQLIFGRQPLARRQRAERDPLLQLFNDAVDEAPFDHHPMIF